MRQKHQHSRRVAKVQPFYNVQPWGSILTPSTTYEAIRRAFYKLPVRIRIKYRIKNQ